MLGSLRGGPALFRRRTRSAGSSPSPASGSGSSGCTAKTGSGALAGADPDLTVYIPITAAQRLLGTGRVDGIAVKAPDRATIGQLGDRIVAELEKRYPGETFSAVTQDQILGVVGRILEPAHPGAGRDRRDQPARRRGRDHQHHAGQRARADPGDRPAQGGRGAAAGRAGAVPAGGGAADHAGRADRDRHRGRRGRGWSASSPRCRPPWPGGRSCWHSACPWRSACSSASPRPGARADSTRWSRCAANDGSGSHPSHQYRYASPSTCVSVVAGGEAGAATRAEVW